jgi:hypothetical protein
MSSDELTFLPPGALRPEEPAYSEDGIDLTLIRSMLSLTPSERLQQLEDFIRSVEDIRAQQGRCASESS